MTTKRLETRFAATDVRRWAVWVRKGPLPQIGEFRKPDCG